MPAPLLFGSDWDQFPGLLGAVAAALPNAREFTVQAEQRERDDGGYYPPEPFVPSYVEVVVVVRVPLVEGKLG
jgi:hypothetical protein